MQTTNNAELSMVLASANAIRQEISEIPDTAVILGSGLGTLAEAMSDKVVIPYAEIPHFPRSTVSHHKGELICGTLGNRRLLAMNGRFHFYEGYEMWETAYPVWVFKMLGIKKLIITNAAGGINTHYRLGDLVCVRDHIKLVADSPVRGKNIPEFGPRFYDMQKAYSPVLCELAMKKAEELGIELKEGIYAFMPGPQFETPAEIRMLRMMGADLVGMSTVPEVIAAAQCQIPVLCVSCVTNMAAGITGAAITEKEVVDTGKLVSDKMLRLISAVIDAI